MGLYENIRDIAKLKGYSVNRLEKELGFARSSINKFNKNTPSAEKIQQIADLLNVSVDYLMTGEELNRSEVALTPKDEREIGRDLNRIMYEIENDVNGPLYYEGKPISQKHLILLKNAIEIALEDAKRKNKETYTPKKYKDKEEN